MTSPLPEITNRLPGSPTRSSASRRRRYRSARQSLASSMAARVRLPNFSSLPSKRSNSVKASAVPPAKPATTLPPARLRTLRALDFITVAPRVTWPSPPRAMRPLRRTASMVVECGSKAWLISSPCVYKELAASARARMRTFVDAGEVLEIKVGVDLRGADAGVTQQLLHGAQVAARLEQVRGK